MLCSYRVGEGSWLVLICMVHLAWETLETWLILSTIKLFQWNFPWVNSERCISILLFIIKWLALLCTLYRWFCRVHIKTLRNHILPALPCWLPLTYLLSRFNIHIPSLLSITSICRIYTTGSLPIPTGCHLLIRTHLPKPILIIPWTPQRISLISIIMGFHGVILDQLLRPKLFLFLLPKSILLHDIIIISMVCILRPILCLCLSIKSIMVEVNLNITSIIVFRDRVPTRVSLWIIQRVLCRVHLGVRVHLPLVMDIDLPCSSWWSVLSLIIYLIVTPWWIIGGLFRFRFGSFHRV